MMSLQAGSLLERRTVSSAEEISALPGRKNVFQRAGKFGKLELESSFHELSERNAWERWRLAGEFRFLASNWPAKRRRSKEVNAEETRVQFKSESSRKDCSTRTAGRGIET